MATSKVNMSRVAQTKRLLMHGLIALQDIAPSSLTVDQKRRLQVLKEKVGRTTSAVQDFERSLKTREPS